MTLTYRLLKGAPLTAAEVDDNFRTLDERLTDLETKQASHGPITCSTERAGEITFKNDMGDVVATVSLPIPKMTPRGLWNSQTPYDFWHICTHDHRIYICHTPHMSGARFDGDTHWALLFEGGQGVGPGTSMRSASSSSASSSTSS